MKSQKKKKNENEVQIHSAVYVSFLPAFCGFLSAKQFFFRLEHLQVGSFW